VSDGLEVWVYRLRCRATGVCSSYHATITEAVTAAQHRAEYSQEDLEVVRVDGAPLNPGEKTRVREETAAAFRLRALFHKGRSQRYIRRAQALENANAGE